MNLTNQQLIHRAYLGSPLWAKKRLEALEHHGAICARCGSHGSDVHHKTYERTGGNELMTDLEVLCRPCHETHHRVERAIRGHKNRRKGINVTALIRYLTQRQKNILCERFSLTDSELYAAVVTLANSRLTREAVAMVGKDYAYISQRKQSMHTVRQRDRSRWGGPKHHAKTMC